MTGAMRENASEGGWPAAADGPVTLLEAMAVARRSVSLMTDQPIDGVAGTERTDAGGWKVTVETIEGAARMGDNDLLAAYEVSVAADGEITGFRRIARYHREDGTP